ncbi:MAG: helix-hairpin-helix domain-containing protein [Prevotellaceae bacterium]|jgi:competence ComEA-like helix-hairpin-helix protein|nr:helix-hairpin-helix domain-containing protein [Prevotellaceae bacterium]
MMTKFSKNLKELFSFTRNERIAVAVLFAILMIVFLYPYIAPKPDINDDGFEDFKLLVDEFENGKAESETAEQAAKAKDSQQQKQKKQTETFDFDPNTADENTFVRLGFSQKQAAVIINYRNKGGKFKTADDFKKMYVVDDKNFERLQPYIKIKLQADKSTENKEKPDYSTHNNTTAARTYIFVEINSADTAELKKLHGIGSYYAHLIVDYRNKLGGFANINQLKEIRRMDDERIQMFANQVKIDTLLINKFNINTLTVKELSQHPYINSYTAHGIAQYRDFAGKIENLQQLVKEKILTTEQAEKLKYYVEF